MTERSHTRSLQPPTQKREKEESQEHGPQANNVLTTISPQKRHNTSFPLQIPIPLQIPPPGGETPRSSAFPFASLPLHPRSPCDGGGEANEKDKSRPANITLSA
ncbi:hypothetical protein PoB_006627500 [Plakobranchus ocellatus]|uniref:Uncharacterized protein n=1 Tax=Plakobranchus ocellatus TaxID=259542 RepID=A0AAV4D6R9_9GAST|nr:hypothetical protein PoB_006627500 [Plakobranchus ocellatus]